mgnify:CR=1 FL=1
MPRFLNTPSFRKEDGSMLSEADLAAQTAFAAALPLLIGCPMLGEEMTAQQQADLWHNHSDGLWIVDPIDGTNNFVAQKADFAVVLAYFENGIGQFGVIYDVIGDKLYHGGGQFDVYCNEQKLPSYQDRPLNQFLMASSQITIGLT